MGQFSVTTLAVAGSILSGNQQPYVKRQKNDAADAEAICEAVTRPNMRFVPVKTEEQQAVLVLHRSRDLLMRQRTMILNAIRSHCAEFGIIAAQGARKVSELVTKLRNDDTLGVPEVTDRPWPSEGRIQQVYYFQCVGVFEGAPFSKSQAVSKYDANRGTGLRAVVLGGRTKPLRGIGT